MTDSRRFGAPAPLRPNRLPCRTGHGRLWAVTGPSTVAVRPVRSSRRSIRPSTDKRGSGRPRSNSGPGWGGPSGGQCRALRCRHPGARSRLRYSPYKEQCAVGMVNRMFVNLARSTTSGLCEQRKDRRGPRRRDRGPRPSRSYRARRIGPPNGCRSSPGARAGSGRRPRRANGFPPVSVAASLRY